MGTWSGMDGIFAVVTSDCLTPDQREALRAELVASVTGALDLVLDTVRAIRSRAPEQRSSSAPQVSL